MGLVGIDCGVDRRRVAGRIGIGNGQTTSIVGIGRRRLRIRRGGWWVAWIDGLTRIARTSRVGGLSRLRRGVGWRFGWRLTQRWKAQQAGRHEPPEPQCTTLHDQNSILVLMPPLERRSRAS